MPGWTAAYGASYLLLDWLSQRFTDQTSAVSSWNPAIALILIAILTFGRRSVPVTVLTAAVSTVVFRSPHEPVAVAIAEGLMIGVIYSVAALALLSKRVAFDPGLATSRDLVILLGVAVAGSAAAAMINSAALLASGVVGLRDLGRPSLRYWVGDLIGIAIVTPLGLLLLQSKLSVRFDRIDWLQLAVIIGLLNVAILGREAGRFPYFYFLFFPVIWAALRAGLPGVVLSLAIIQAGMFLAVWYLRIDFVDVTDFQARMVSLAATGLIAGALVSEQRRVEVRSRVQQSALAQVATRGSMGELGTAIAHEVNQPLSAAGTYATLVVESLAAEKLHDQTTLDNARKVVRQIERASAVVRRLRALVRLARDDQAPVFPSTIVSEVHDLTKHEALTSGIEVRLDLDPRLPSILVDRLQVEQALINLTRNSIEAIRDAGMAGGVVTIYAREAAGREIELGVVDNGPGFAPGFSLDHLQPFQSTKQDGLGVGLSLCQSVALANGGKLIFHPTDVGAHVCIVFGPDRRVSDV